MRAILVRRRDANNTRPQQHEEDAMSSSDTGAAAPTQLPEPGELRLEVVVVPVSDVDRAKAFYVDTLGWRLDADFPGPDGFRIVQTTPPGSQCSVSFGDDITAGVPGSYQDMTLVVRDVEATRADLAARGVDVTEVFHDAGGIFHHAGTKARVPGPAADRGTYGSWVSFSDPDGNSWMVQEITTRLPGR
jgi:catechol 2,3-dioxygenase-like lactoylglutathione lyase family enzyme